MLRDFGHRIGNPRLANIVIFLYKAARADSTRKTYAVGQRHWLRFHKLHPKIPFSPLLRHPPTPSRSHYVSLQATSRPVLQSLATRPYGVIYAT